ncbi:MAG: diaminopimelate decarboxylase [Patescibacteria group bacterium]
MSMPINFQERLFPLLPGIIEHFNTPFHIYDEAGIIAGGRRLINAFGGLPFREFFAVKANPNPAILRLMQSLCFGFDCSSVPELRLVREIGARPEDIMFTSNNTALEEFRAAAEQNGCILNLDDITLVPKVPDPFPELICFRYNPGPRRTGNSIIGNPVEAKYGVAHEQIVEAYAKAIKRGATRFGLHTMVCSNELNYKYMVETVQMLLDVLRLLTDKLKIKFEFINMGGGLGIPYKPEDKELPLEQMAGEIKELLRTFQNEQGYVPRLFLESGRWITGPHGILVARCINKKNTYREYRGLDACMSDLMRPGMYYPGGGYHQILVPGKASEPTEVVDVVGSLCENCDKFAVQRELPRIAEGDIVIIADTGAHGYGMGYNYNGRLRHAELMLRENGSVELIRRAETFEDYVRTLQFEPDVLRL